jgi:hypothetical protein
MAQVAATVGTDDFGSQAIGIWDTLYRAGNFIVEARPTTVAFEFVL